MSYVDAGYSIALSALFLYGIGLGLRRRRWERALNAAEPAEPAAGVAELAAGVAESAQEKASAGPRS